MTEKVNTWLPVFPGFYCTLFEPCDEDIVCEQHDMNYDQIEWDYDEYQNICAEHCVDYIETELNTLGFNVKLKLEKVSSPREYNFANDAIHIECEFDRKELMDFILDTVNDFDDYIKEKYTSYDGFLSFHSNDYKDWIHKLCNEKADNLQHEIGAVLQFICEMNDINQESMYEYFVDTGQSSMSLYYDIPE